MTDEAGMKKKLSRFIEDKLVEAARTLNISPEKAIEDFREWSSTFPPKELELKMIEAWIEKMKKPLCAFICVFALYSS